MNQQARPMLTPTSNRWATDIFLLFIGITVFYFLWLGSYPLFTPDEGRYTEVAREMLITHDFITPRVNGIIFLDKPILYYWLQTIALYLFGLKEWAIRFFPALCGVMGCITTYISGRIVFNRTVGILAAIILATTPLYFGGAHYADLNIEVSVFISVALLLFLAGLNVARQHQKYFFLTAYAFSGLAFLTKGLIGLAFPMLTVFFWLLFTNRWQILKQVYVVWGILIFLSITLPWYILAQQANPKFLHYFFVTQQVTRFLSKGEFNNKTPLWFYIPIILFGCLPWSLFIFGSFKIHFKNCRASIQKHANELFLIIWFFVVLIFFSIPRTKIVGYIFPVCAPLALLIAIYFENTWPRFKTIFLICTTMSVIALMSLVLNAEKLNNRSTKYLVSELNTLAKNGDEIVGYYKFYQDLPIYLNQKITLVADWRDPGIMMRDNWVREFLIGLNFDSNVDHLITEEQFWQRYHDNKRMFVFLNDNYFDQFKKTARHYFIINRDHDIILLSNLPTYTAKNKTYPQG